MLLKRRCHLTSQSSSDKDFNGFESALPDFLSMLTQHPWVAPFFCDKIETYRYILHRLPPRYRLKLLNRVQSRLIARTSTTSNKADSDFRAQISRLIGQDREPKTTSTKRPKLASRTADPDMSSLTGWHPGERVARQKTGFDAIPATRMLWASISGEMPEQHSTFYTTRLPFIPVCILVADGEGGAARPWGSFLVGKDGKPGFVTHPQYNTLRVHAALADGDPFLRVGASENEGDDEMPMIAGIGVEVSTRRRNKFAGHITKMVRKGKQLDMDLVVNEAIGNCPKYITLRELAPVNNRSLPDIESSATQPHVVEDKLHLSPEDRLSDDALSFIQGADTIFLGTAYIAPANEAKAHPSHLGMNHRGGRPGFVRVKGDGRTVIIPDISGNRFMTSLGNIEATPLASISIPSFTSGDVLYLTGTARNVYGAEAQAMMPFQDRLTEIYITGYTFVRAALPLRVVPDYKIEGSPYSPPIKLLAEELPKGSQLFMNSGQGLPKARLLRVDVHSPDLATFTWEMVETSDELAIKPGQAAILDFKTLLGERRYAHMMPGKPAAVNDDFVRTWTVSDFSLWSRASDESERKTTFALTMREKEGGTVTGALFSIVRKLQQVKPQVLDDARDLDLQVGLVGISGDFVLAPTLSPPALAAAVPQKQKLVWVAGGIGITPFLAMLRAITSANHASGSAQHPTPDITLVVSTREIDVMAALVSHALRGRPLPASVSVHIFSTRPGSPSADAPASASASVQVTHDSGLTFSQYPGRVRLDAVLNPETLPSVSGGQVAGAAGETQFYVCGPLAFETAISDSLMGFGVLSANIYRETFAY